MIKGGESALNLKASQILAPLKIFWQPSSLLLLRSVLVRAYQEFAQPNAVAQRPALVIGFKYPLVKIQRSPEK